MGVDLYRRFQSPWWSQGWLDLLTECDPSRMQRARQYAQQGRVYLLGDENGRVQARVKGGRSQAYYTSLHFAPLPAAVQSFLQQALRAFPQIELIPYAWEQALHLQGHSLLPDPDIQMGFDCSCPDWSAPCKHALAVACVLAEDMARDPSLLLRLQGFEPQLECLPALEAPPLSADPVRFWGQPLPAPLLLRQPDRFSHPPLKQLGPLPGPQAARKRVEEALLPVYQQAAQQAAALLLQTLQAQEQVWPAVADSAAADEASRRKKDFSDPQSAD
ncbi:MAG: SWIM zinc finger family protein [Candidatus Sericytochromatia bacterium]|nr:SWIM zinc finger family protein [Candidatus Sericytochromatia bacterium]